MELFTNLVTAGVNYGLQRQNQKEQNQFNAEEAAKARNETFALNEQAANNADARTRALFNDLYSPSAQMEQYRKAGINPSLMLSKGLGGSGSSGAQGGAGNATASSSGTINPNFQGGNLLQDIAQLKAMKGVDYQNEKTKQEARALELDNNLKEENQKRDKELEQGGKQASNKAQEIENEINEHNKDFTKWSNRQKMILEVNDLFWKCQNAEYDVLNKIEELDARRRENAIGDETYQTRIDLLTEELNNRKENTLLMKSQRKAIQSGIELNAKQIEVMEKTIQKANLEMTMLQQALRKGEIDLKTYEKRQEALTNQLVAESKLSEFQEDHKWANFMQQQITGYVHSFNETINAGANVINALKPK